MSLLDHETQQLNGYHERLAVLDSAGQASLLRNGFLPDSPEGLIEAGIRCIPLIESGDLKITDGALDRLDAIQVKLNLRGDGPQIREALERFEEILREHRRREASDTRMGLVFILGLCLLVGGLVAYLAYLVAR